jgi:hypothetical protein
MTDIGESSVTTGAKAPGLGNNGNTLPHHSSDYSANGKTWDALGWLWENSELESVRHCRKAVMDNQGHQGVAGLECSETGKARYSGLKTCGSVWACPVCSERVMKTRRDQVFRCLVGAHDLEHVVTFSTLTMRHHAGQSLAHVWDGVSKAMNSVNTVRKMRDLRAEMGHLGAIRRVEVTHGASGWHVHVHLIEFWESSDLNGKAWAAWLGELQDVEPGEVDSYRAAMFTAWRNSLVKTGYDAPSWEHGADVKLAYSPVDAAEKLNQWMTSDAIKMADYATKPGGVLDGLAWEVASATTKGGKPKSQTVKKMGNRTPWQILAGAMAGDPADIKLWADWEEGSKGRRALYVSPKLTALYPELGEEVDQDAPQEVEVSLCHLDGEAYADLLYVSNPGRLLRFVEECFSDAMDAGADRWGSWQAAQDGARAYLLAHGVTEGVAWTDLEYTRQMMEAPAVVIAAAPPSTPLVGDDVQGALIAPDLPSWWSWQ